MKPTSEKSRSSATVASSSKSVKDARTQRPHQSTPTPSNARRSQPTAKPHPDKNKKEQSPSIPAPEPPPQQQQEIVTAEQTSSSSAPPPPTPPAAAVVPEKPAYILSVDAAAAQESAVHFSVKTGSFVPVVGCGFSEEEPPSTTPDPHLEKSSARDTKSAAQGEEKKLRNGLSFINRGVQTNHWPSKDRETSSQLRSCADASGSCSAWEIYDAHLAAEGAPAPGAIADEKKKSPEHNEHHHVTTVMQRIIHQNLNPELAADFKYWEDPADLERPDEGTLLPLWHFTPTVAAKGRAVTALAWNLKQKDLFAAGYGSFDPGRPLSGLVALYSLADAEQPECELPIPSSVLCLAFHPAMPSIMVVGCLDGSVHVLDFADLSNPRIRASSPVATRHGDGVWSVGWAAGEPPGRRGLLRFQAASSDGSLVTWELTAAEELTKREIRTLSKNPLPGGQGTGFAAAAAAVSTTDAHPVQPSLLLVGTHEGEVLRYPLADMELERAPNAFSGHVAPVYSVQWSPLHPTAFLTASADWTIRLWDADTPGQALHVFDMGAPVGDVSWSPTVSTVFAAVTDSGRVVVYDLSRSMYVPLCKQKVTQKVKLTKLAFSPAHPVLLVGDEKGSVTCFKLSPNLRKMPQQKTAEKGRAGGAERRRLQAAAAAAGGRGGYGGEDDASAAANESVEERSKKAAAAAAALQKEHLGKVLAVASSTMQYNFI